MTQGNFIHGGRSIDGRINSGGLPVTERQALNDDGSDAHRPALPWFATAAWGALLCAAYPLLAIAPLVVLNAMGGDADHSTVAHLGINCALVGFTLLSMQFVLTARLPWIEAPFGLDLILRFHRAMAIVIVALLCAHPLLLAAAESWHLLTRLHAHWYIWAGRITLFLLAAQVITALLRGAMRLSYERWRRTHNLVALSILALGFAHGVTAAGHDLANAGEVAMWAFAPTAGFATWLYARAIRPHLLARRAFRVQSVELEAPRVWTVTLDTPTGQPFRFSPGQFQFLRFVESKVPAEEHPFTIASSPSQAGRIGITIKACGNFTNLIHRIQVGDGATVHGPFGRFSHDFHPDEGHLVFVAGGVGITPLMSMLRAMRDRGESRQVTLIYASRELDDILFAPELIAMEAGQFPKLKVILVLSQAPSRWAGETGRVDVPRLEKWCQGLEDKAFYMCCPPQMNDELIRGLLKRGVSPRRIHCDYFSL
jgi:predicted ferric reductase